MKPKFTDRKNRKLPRLNYVPSVKDANWAPATAFCSRCGIEVPEGRKWQLCDICERKGNNPHEPVTK